ncbi:MAG: sodium-dependent transporter [Muribaculaceae bacterium]|nr:sodium-dependent transporter [Muribaculaceae bacterium]
MGKNTTTSSSSASPAGGSGGALFKTKAGVIAATLGSAVGLGSIWRFPAEAQANGGGAFLLLYLACVLVLGIPVMLAETSLGRAGRADAVGSYMKLAPGKHWWIAGALGVLASYLIISFYMVVAGWTLQYLWDSISGALYDGAVSESALALESTFHHRMERYIGSDMAPLISTFVMIALNAGVLMMGVQKGIERASNIMMPLLFVLLLIFSIYALTLPGAGEGLEFFFRPDFSKITWSVAANALGQTFFSLSLGIGILITYASYYPSSTNLVSTSVTVSVLTTFVAVMMGVIIFPTVFSFNLDLSQLRGTTLVFVTLPEVFSQMPGGRWWSVLFFLLLLVAALTSTISLSEVSILFVQKRFRRSRVAATLIMMCPLFLFSALCSLSFGSLADLKLFGLTIFNFLDTFTTNWLLPVCAFCTVIFMGWFAPRGTLRDQVTDRGTVATRLYPAICFIVRWVAPVLILVILITSI